jgi:pyrroloquinoline quinone biosynthesis protein B
MLHIKVLGSAAGGGVPQWNCNFQYSRRARAGDVDVSTRLQSSIAASTGAGWVVFNASPDIRAQMAATPELQPAADADLRSTPISAVVLTNADVDHIAGLLSLRERQRFNLYASGRVLSVLEQNPIFRVLDQAYVRRIELPIDREVEIDGPDGSTGLRVMFYPVPGKVALFLETGDARQDFNAAEGDTVGVRMSAANGGGVAHYVPGCAAVSQAVKDRVFGAEVVLFDGTVFTDNEMAEAGVGDKTGQRMGHLAISGEDGSAAALNDVKLGRRIYIHINNTNPILDARSKARRFVEAAGWEVAYDGMEIRL